MVAVTGVHKDVMQPKGDGRRVPLMNADFDVSPRRYHALFTLVLPLKFAGSELAARCYFADILCAEYAKSSPVLRSSWMTARLFVLFLHCSDQHRIASERVLNLK
jgi:hypothetical protein